MCTSDGNPTIRRGASFDISFCTDTVMPRRSTPSSSALKPIVVLMQVPSAVATRSVGENASPLPLLSVGASVAIVDCDGPCVASQCRSPVYLISTLTMLNYAARFQFVMSTSPCFVKDSEIRHNGKPFDWIFCVCAGCSWGLGVIQQLLN